MNIKLKMEAGSDEVLVFADMKRIMQVLTNLIVNAIKYSDEGCRVDVSFVSEEKKVGVFVIDNGPGIPVEIRTRIFEPFFTTRSATGGTGLGLSYCLNVVEGHGGTLRVDDSAHTGTVITLSLPEAREHDQELALESDMPTELVSLRVLMVDDEIELLDAMVESLGKFGHSVVGVTSGVSALERLKSENFDVVLSDLRMRGMDGPKFYKLACELQPRMRDRFVFITGDALTDRVLQFLDRVALPQVNKPFDIETVRAVIRSFERIDHEPRPKTGPSSA